MIGVSNRAYRVDLTAHVQRLPLGGGQCEIHGRSCAVGWWRRGISAGLSPQSHHVLFGDSRLRSGVIHHELLNSQGPERIKNQQLQRLGLITQHLLRMQ